MVQLEVVARKLAVARKRFAEADEIFSRDREEFLADERERDLGMFYLLLVIQECIDLAAHWVADADWGPPEDVDSAFDILADQGAITPELAHGLRAATALRHRIAHGYASVDSERVYEEYRRGKEHLLAFLARVAENAGLGGEDE